jgi:hypothetical protein
MPSLDSQLQARAAAFQQWRRGEDGRRVWRRHSTPLEAGRMPGADASV